METFPPSDNRAKPQAQLDAILAAERAIRDSPWPTWLYIVNCALPTSIAASSVLGSLQTLAIMVLVILTFAANAIAGIHTGVPFAVPRSRVFIALMAMASIAIVVSLVAGMIEVAPLVMSGSVAAGVLSALAFIVHARGTRR